ncbi:MAG: phage portal protein, partial [Rhizobiales bacterium]|nr:phage portal protein [Hyphomicrobiales bacterium]
MEALNASILAGATTAARRAGWYARNNPWVASAVQGLVANAIGAGVKPRSLHPDPTVRERLHGLWRRWTDRSDAAGLTDFYGLQALALRAMIESGESFARLRFAEADDGLPPLSIDLLDREQVPTDLHRDVGGGVRIRAGIEFDAAGRRIAYHSYRHRPGDALAPMALDTVRVPAADMAHLFQPLAAGQLRGITWLAPILLRLHELDQYEDAALVKAKVAALFTGFIRDPDGTVAGLNNGSAVNGVLNVGMEPGSLIPLPPGADIQFSDPADPGDYGAFVKNHIRAIASGLGVPYELVSGDLEGVTYSSIRAGLVEFRRRIEQLQYAVIVFQFCRPVWERFVRLAALSGAIDARGFDRDTAPWLAVEWLPPKWEWVDPLKDARAE